MTKEFDQARIELRQKVYRKKERVLLDKNDDIGNIYGRPDPGAVPYPSTGFAGIGFANNGFEPEYGRNFLVNCGTCSSHKEPTPITK